MAPLNLEARGHRPKLTMKRGFSACSIQKNKHLIDARCVPEPCNKKNSCYIFSNAEDNSITHLVIPKFNYLKKCINY